METLKIDALVRFASTPLFFHFNLSVIFAGRERTGSRNSFAVSFHLLRGRRISTPRLRSSMSGGIEIDQLD